MPRNKTHRIRSLVSPCVTKSGTIFALVLCLAMGPSASVASPAAGPDSAQAANARAKEALEAYRSGQYEKSIQGYKEAYALEPAPRYLFALGLSYLRLGQAGPAMEYFERFARESPDPEDSRMRQLAAKHIEEVQRTTSLVTLEVSPEGAEVHVEGQPRWRSPLSEKVRLRNGEHLVRVSLAGHRSEERRFHVGPGRPNSVEIRLASIRTEDPVPLRSPGVRPLRITGYVSVGLAAASVVAAAILGGLSARAKKNVEQAEPGTMWEPGLAQDFRNVGRFRTGAWVAGSLGAAFLGTGVTLLWLDGRSGRERRAWILPDLGPGQVSLGFGMEL